MWPCRPVCEALESVRSESLGEGFQIGVRNERGVHEVTSGVEERKLAETYHDRARRLSYEFPYVSTLATSIAKAYEAEAEYWETRAEIDRRLDW